MSQQIEVPNIGIVEFPDSMNDEQIKTVIRRKSGAAAIAANPPGVPRPADPIMSAGREMLIGPQAPGNDINDTALDAAKGMAKGIFSTTAPNIAHQIHQQSQGKPFDLESPIENAWMMMAGELGTPDVPPNLAAAAARPPVAAPRKFTFDTPGLAKNLGREVTSKIPILGRFDPFTKPSASDYLDLVKRVPPPAQPTPEVPAHWGKVVGPPDMWGKTIPQETTPEPKTFELPETPAPISQTAASKTLDSALREAVGNKPIQPRVKIRDQFKLPEKSGAPIPEGHTAVESSAVKSYKYDSSANELHVHTPDGTTYVFGDVAPEDAAAFESAPSKGKAWKVIRDKSTLVAKIPPSGTRISVKPAGPRTFDPNDLTDVLKQSLDQAKR